MSALWDRLLSPGAPDDRLSTWDGEGFHDRTWADLVRDGERAGGGLRRLGVAPGTPVGCILTNDHEVAAGLLGIWLAGGTALSLPTPARGMPLDEYADQLRSICAGAGAELLLVADEYAGAFAGDDTLRVESFSRLPAGSPAAPELPADDAPCFVQYSSGSTSAPKGCVLTARAMAAQLEALHDRIRPDEAPDRDALGVVSWLPLSHDMGLFGGFMYAWAYGLPLRLSTPARFLRSPRTWLDDCAETEATFTVGPGFGLGLALRGARRRAPAGPLRLQTWIVGSDPIDAGLLEQADDLLGPGGLPPTAITPAYGLAEATLAVSMAGLEARPRALSVALTPLYEGHVEPATGSDDDAVARLVSTGRAVAGTEISIDGPGVGEIVVRSPSRAEGYLGDAERTKRTFPEPGVLRTGDLGFLHDGELFIVGRQDDVISVGGRNIHASELEARFGRDPRIRSGACTLVDVTADRRRLVLLTEPADEDGDFAATARAMSKIAASAGGVGIDECVFVPRGTLPKSPSGKVQRHRCRRLVTDDDGDALARVRVR